MNSHPLILVITLAAASLLSCKNVVENNMREFAASDNEFTIDTESNRAQAESARRHVFEVSTTEILNGFGRHELVKEGMVDAFVNRSKTNSNGGPVLLVVGDSFMCADSYRLVENKVILVNNISYFFLKQDPEGLIFAYLNPQLAQRAWGFEMGSQVLPSGPQVNAAIDVYSTEVRITSETKINVHGKNEVYRVRKLTLSLGKS